MNKKVDKKAWSNVSSNYLMVDMPMNSHLWLVKKILTTSFSIKLLKVKWMEVILGHVT